MGTELYISVAWPNALRGIKSCHKFKSVKDIDDSLIILFLKQRYFASNYEVVNIIHTLCSIIMFIQYLYSSFIESTFNLVKQKLNDFKS